MPSRLRLVSRRLLRAPLFTSVAILTLALGIGANSAIFSVVNGVLLKPLPFHDAGRLVGVWHSAPGISFPTLDQAPSTYFLSREEGRTFEDIALYAGGSVSVTGIGDPESQLLLPFRFNRAEVRLGQFSYRGIARLKPDVIIEQASADIARLIPLLIERFPLPPGFRREMFEQVKLAPNVHPLSVDVIGDVGQVLRVLLGTVGIVLLIACANVANLFSRARRGGSRSWPFMPRLARTGGGWRGSCWPKA